MNRPSFDSRYAFISSAVRALETGLLSSPDIDLLLKTSSSEEALELLVRISPAYTADAGGFAAVRRFPERHNALFRFLDLYAPRRETELFFRSPHDYNNLKALIRYNIFSPPVEPELSDFGSTDAESLKNIIFEEAYDILPPEMETAAVNAIFMYYENRHPVIIDLVIDAALMEHLTGLAAQSGSPLLSRYIELRADLTNINTILRAGSTISDPSIIPLLHLPGGTITSQEVALIRNDSEAIAALLHRMDLPAAAKAVTEYREYPGAVEREIDNALTQFLRQTLYYISSVETMFAYCYAVELEMKILRTVLLGKAAGIDEAAIRRSIPEPFSG
ncbi:MAG TPA: V-type ATPase subunit [Spirochaetota bacterium]|nr:V-type ATPase subunit [Spirochaetota bacterium]